jgi:cobalt/nickel transport system permease protein
VQPASHKHNSAFIERTLTEINNALEQSLFAEKIARQNGLLQALDARFKLISTLALLLAIALSHNVIVLLVLSLEIFILAAFSKVPPGFFIKRVWGVVLLFSGVIALPSLFITPGPALYQLMPGLLITRTGAMSALFLLLRVSASVSTALLLVLTTPWNAVLKALGVLHVPDVLVLTIGMTYRYIHLLLHLTNDMFLSRKSRILKKMKGEEERRLLAATSAVLLGKSLQVSSDVYLAMQSRGYHGYPRTLDSFQAGWKDWTLGLLLILTALVAIWLGR